MARESLAERVALQRAAEQMALERLVIFCRYCERRTSREVGVCCACEVKHQAAQTVTRPANGISHCSRCNRRLRPKGGNVKDPCSKCRKYPHKVFPKVKP